MKPFFRGITLICVLLISGVGLSFAATNSPQPSDAARAQTKFWTGNAQLGGVMNTGNTQSGSLSGQLTLNYKRKKWENTGTVQGQLGTSSGSLNAMSVRGTAESDYFFEPLRFVFTRGRVAFDRFSAYDYVGIVSGGYGWRLWSLKDLSLDVQVGPGFRFEKQSKDGTHNNDLILQPAMKFLWKFSKTAQLAETLSLDWGYLSKKLFLRRFRNRFASQTHW